MMTGLLCHVVQTLAGYRPNTRMQKGQSARASSARHGPDDPSNSEPKMRLPHVTFTGVEVQLIVESMRILERIQGFACIPCGK
jgi:hypothetical protein